ncbi:MAG: DUF4258 domain-containing protein [Candidatus Pseudobacter hemicellulosilyticus]|uniref:DUF4258 domain-containing protein n=1 Tax=Candidatus Pseudobacter hemicellulosilyticus TaxID=3121375 RepID=A0AAJ5WNX8_9BACT|nr:MAG: DUF4258 domain-containing protein [Pseudobacter sp.]
MRLDRSLFWYLLSGWIFLLSACGQSADPGAPGNTTDAAAQQPGRPGTPPSENPPDTPAGFDRKAARLIFTKHARCRMGCRHIDEQEVREILEKGKVNIRKSEPAGRPDPKFALEGKTRDGQQVRIIFAASQRGMVVITVIDLDTNWTCDCR